MNPFPAILVTRRSFATFSNNNKRRKKRRIRIEANRKEVARIAEHIMPGRALRRPLNISIQKANNKELACTAARSWDRVG